MVPHRVPAQGHLALQYYESIATSYGLAQWALVLRVPTLAASIPSWCCCRFPGLHSTSEADTERERCCQTEDARVRVGKRVQINYGVEVRMEATRGRRTKRRNMRPGWGLEAGVGTV